MKGARNAFSVDGETYFAETVKSVRINRRYRNWVYVALSVWFLVGLLYCSYFVGASLFFIVPPDAGVFLKVIFLFVVIYILLLLCNKKDFSVLIVDLGSRRVAVFGSCNYGEVELIKQQFLDGLETGNFPRLSKPFIEKKLMG